MDLQRLTDEELETLLHAAAAEELRRHQQRRRTEPDGIRPGVQATTPREGQ